MKKNRMQQEIDILLAMIDIYCKANHSTGNSLCDDCIELAEYAKTRTINCRHGNSKPPCFKCKTHCYKPYMREKIKSVMKFSGPRMIYKHPIMTIKHAIDYIIY